MSNNLLELADVIEALRENLTEAQQRGIGKNIHFDVNNVEIELQTVIKKGGQAGAKAKFWVLEADAQGNYENAVNQKIKLSLQAVEIDPVTGQKKNTLLSGTEPDEK